MVEVMSTPTFPSPGALPRPASARVPSRPGDIFWGNECRRRWPLLETLRSELAPPHDLPYLALQVNCDTKTLAWEWKFSDRS